MAGSIDVMFDPMPSSIARIRSGKTRLTAMSALKMICWLRLTVTEAGLLPLVARSSEHNDH
jgi:hypothetical protein